MQSRRSSRRAEREAVIASGTVQSSPSFTTSATEERRSQQCFVKEMLKQTCYFAIQLQICRWELCYIFCFNLRWQAWGCFLLWWIFLKKMFYLQLQMEHYSDNKAVFVFCSCVSTRGLEPQLHFGSCNANSCSADFLFHSSVIICDDSHASKKRKGEWKEQNETCKKMQIKKKEKHRELNWDSAEGGLTDSAFVCMHAFSL